MKKSFFRYISIFCLLFALQMAAPTTASAQCPMCRISAEKNLAAGGSAGKGLNRGILYMLAAPYLIIGTIGFVWYRNRRKEETEPELPFSDN
ncbi:MAG: hypothetical protein AAFV95_15920 [Bacteroidota bacterium]